MKALTHSKLLWFFQTAVFKINFEITVFKKLLFYQNASWKYSRIITQSAKKITAILDKNQLSHSRKKNHQPLITILLVASPFPASKTLIFAPETDDISLILSPHLPMIFPTTFCATYKSTLSSIG